MSVIGTILIGLIVGLIARLLHPGRDRLGLFMTTLLGIAGAMVATYGGQFLGVYRVGETAGFVGAVVGAVILLFVFTKMKN
ncbi:GlsB/YeaQ/YmgE family stress response membrane protein [Azoarcus indigens]|uniref:Putative membrane protein YeaQ/YmgE (Transglycosylase-associated protein family) n=1 Tax=Azoarcus indigens TaxID=29545 RepID=A0A4R6DVJ7_9RHOO|nr:GlsB/YeaQ/YmgE family stress response membrane protein [Azoarcus indigens]NMG64308.1 GlsB/YeaQ/YmgE family stress response membrane protein [Azoarcus indigens]TDN49241.1 putative membrane protein YeaQ/YmgE (transglycosylase-associated protein family) [Azoarcus indigens]